MKALDPFGEPRRPGVRFGGTEILHLAAAVLMLTVAFAFVMAEGRGLGVRVKFLLEQPLIVLAAFLAVGSGFVLHELAHKVVAQQYGHWAEFRAQLPGLGISVLIAVAVKVLFAAPGAVHIYGRVTPRENGIISLVGPGVNFAIALAMLPFTFVSNPDAPLPTVMTTIGFVNALLAVFNLIPGGPLDGRKVWRWNRFIWGGSMAAAVALFVPFLMEGILAA